MKRAGFKEPRIPGIEGPGNAAMAQLGGLPLNPRILDSLIPVT